MKAKEAAEIVSQKPKTSIDEIKGMIPDYTNPLHYRQWVYTFLKHLPQGLQPNYRTQLLQK